MHRVILVVLASSAVGGVIGALATAATESQASPQAIAAAVQHVQDQSAERSLANVAGKLATIAAGMQVLDRSFSGSIISPLYTIENQLFDICLNTESGSATSVPVTCPTPTIEP